MASTSGLIPSSLGSSPFGSIFDSRGIIASTPSALAQAGTVYGPGSIIPVPGTGQMATEYLRALPYTETSKPSQLIVATSLDTHRAGPYTPAEKRELQRKAKSLLGRAVGFVGLHRHASLVWATSPAIAKDLLRVEESLVASDIMTCTRLIATKRRAVIIMRPQRVTTNTTDVMLHNAKGPARVWPSGEEEWWYKGVKMKARHLREPHRITRHELMMETNAEVRRRLFELVQEAKGTEGLAKRLKLEWVDAHPRFGTLWAIAGAPSAQDARMWSPAQRAPFRFLEVTNRTAEPDGSFKRYFLKVPPTIKSALEAAAWTFDMSPETYAQLDVET